MVGATKVSLVYLEELHKFVQCTGDVGHYSRNLRIKTKNGYVGVDVEFYPAGCAWSYSHYASGYGRKKAEIEANAPKFSVVGKPSTYNSKSVQSLEADGTSTSTTNFAHVQCGIIFILNEGDTILLTCPDFGASWSGELRAFDKYVGVEHDERSRFWRSVFDDQKNPLYPLIEDLTIDNNGFQVHTYSSTDSDSPTNSTSSANSDASANSDSSDNSDASESPIDVVTGVRRGYVQMPGFDPQRAACAKDVCSANLGTNYIFTPFAQSIMHLHKPCLYMKRIITKRQQGKTLSDLEQDAFCEYSYFDFVL
jgi:hypothetical protein